MLRRARKPARAAKPAKACCAGRSPSGGCAAPDFDIQARRLFRKSQFTSVPKAAARSGLARIPPGAGSSAPARRLMRCTGREICYVYYTTHLDRAPCVFHFILRPRGLRAVRRHTAVCRRAGRGSPYKYGLSGHMSPIRTGGMQVLKGDKGRYSPLRGTGISIASRTTLSKYGHNYRRPDLKDTARRILSNWKSAAKNSYPQLPREKSRTGQARGRMRLFFPI